MIRGLLLLALLPFPAIAADFNIASGGDTTFNCGTEGTGPGDTITLNGVTRTGRIIIESCRGTHAAKIVLRNDPTDSAPVIFRNSANTGAAGIELSNSEHITVDGTGGWVGMPNGAGCGAGTENDGCGIQLVALAADNWRPTKYFAINGIVETANRTTACPPGHVSGCTSGGALTYPGLIGITVKGVKIDASEEYTGTTPVRVGLYCHELAISRDDYPGAWKEQFALTDNHITGAYGEGVYCGDNPDECGSGAEECVPHRDMEISRNEITDTGRDSINPKLWLDGDNVIDGNVFARAGLRGQSEQSPCVGMNIVQADVTNNTIIDCGGPGINVTSQDGGLWPNTDDPKIITISNNLIVRTGVTLAGEAWGIRVVTFDTATQARFTPSIYNNTIVDTVGSPVALLRTTGAVVRNNIMAQASACDAGDGVDCTSQTSTISTTNEDNIGVSINNVFFASVVGDNYRITAPSPAVDAATDAPFSATDILGTARTQGGVADAGAYEYIYPAEPSQVSPVRVFRGIQQ